MLDRRRLILGGCAFPLLALPGCSTLGASASMSDPALAHHFFAAGLCRLLQENGFFSDELARVPVPPELGAAASALLRVPLVQNQLLQLMNRAAVEGAEAAAPIVYDSIRSMSIADAVSIVRGGPTAATDYLQRSMGNAIVDAMFPGVGQALRVFDNGVINQVVRLATGIDFNRLQRHVSQAAATGIYRAIGREEAAIRANPRESGDPVLAGVFGLVR